MRYFVTGATGFIGGRIVRQLREAGHEVVALVRPSASNAAGLRLARVALCTGDVTDKESLRAGMAGCDGVFHAAAWYKLGARNGRERAQAERVNVDGTRNVLELVRELNIPKAVYTSTLAVFSDTGGKLADESYRHAGPHLTEYDRTKWLAHYEVALPMIERHHLPLVIVQPGVVYGPGDQSRVHDTFVQYLRGKLRALPRRTAYCWSHVDDAARGHLLAMYQGKPGESYLLAGPVHTLVEVFQLAQTITGVPAPRRTIAPGLLKAAATVLGAVNAVFPVPASAHPEVLRAGSGVTYLGDDAKARRELGYGPRPLAEGLRETLEHEMQELGMTPRAGETEMRGRSG